jgi:RNA polymerase sigma-70 factor, ECF subfamily
MGEQKNALASHRSGETTVDSPYVAPVMSALARAESSFGINRFGRKIDDRADLDPIPAWNLSVLSTRDNSPIPRFALVANPCRLSCDVPSSGRNVLNRPSMVMGQQDDPERPIEHIGDFVRLIAQLEHDPRLRGKLDPADAVQQTLLKALQKQDQFRGRTGAELGAWLRTILARHLADTGRKLTTENCVICASIEQSHEQCDLWLVADQSSPSQNAMRKEQKDWLDDALAQLPADQRAALELRHLQGRSISEICDQMSRSTAAVAGLLRRGLKTLRATLDRS